MSTRSCISRPASPAAVSTTYGTGFGINGARNSMLDILVDGVSTAHPTVNGFSGNSTFPPVEAIAEFKVLGSNYSAEFGRSNGGMVNVVYKSGANNFHGSLFEFLRNSKLDANNFFNNRAGIPLGSFKRNQFGAMVNGPIVRNKTFFLGSYEGLRERTPGQHHLHRAHGVCSARATSARPAANGSLIRIFDPFSTRAQAAGLSATSSPAMSSRSR
jgi:hypothetical protein